jgi:predicted flap endonuclease-1-like 5' DNA nuclease
MSKGIVAQLKGLEREKSRLDQLLAPDPNWQVYRRGVAAAPGRPELEVAAELVLPAAVQTALSTNRLFQARRKILDAIELLEDLIARPGAYPEALAQPDDAPPGAEADGEATNAAGQQDASENDSEPEAAGPPPITDAAGEAAGKHGQDAFRTKLKVKESSSLFGTPPGSPVMGAGDSLVRADNLTLIDGIDRNSALVLRAFGITTFRAIAAWTPQDAVSIGRRLGVGERALAQDWAGQAARLAGANPAGEHDQADRADQDESATGVNASDDTATIATDAEPAVATPAPDNGGHLLPLLALGSGAGLLGPALLPGETPEEPARPAPPPVQADNASRKPARLVTSLAKTMPGPGGSVGASLANAIAQPAAAANDDQPDDLCLIQGLTPDDARLLHENGVTGYAIIAAWTTADVRRFRALLGDRRRISREQWIEQAAMLASGVRTSFARQPWDMRNLPLATTPEIEAWERRLPPSPPQVADGAAVSEDDDRLLPQAVSTETVLAESVLPDPVLPEPVLAADVTGLTLPDVESAADAQLADDLQGQQQTADAEMEPAPEPVPDPVPEPIPASPEPATANLDTQKDDTVDAAERRQAALNERIARLEQTISTIVLPDLKRPPPEFPPAPLRPATPPVEPAAEPPSDEAEAGSDRSPLTTFEPVVLTEPDFQIDPGVAPPNTHLADPFDEAEVQIIRIERRPQPGGHAAADQAADPAGAPEPAATSPNPAGSREGWSPFELAKRLDRYAVDDEEAVGATARFMTEVEEASVEIIRRPKPGSEQDDTMAAAAPGSANGAESEAPARQGKPPARRFLSALTGKRKSNP